MDFIILALLIENIIITLNMKEYTYESFFVTGLEKFHSGGLFVSLFGKLYTIIPKNVMLSILIFMSAFLFLYVFGKIIGFLNRVAENKKNSQYALNKAKSKEEKIKIKQAKKEKKGKKEETEEVITEIQEDFMVDIKKEFHSILQGKSRQEARFSPEDERRRRIQEGIRERHEQRKNENEEKTEIVFLKENDLKTEETRINSLEQKKLSSYPNEYVQLAKSLEISVEKLEKAIELVHKFGVRGSGSLAKELNLNSDDAERVYIKVKRLKEL